MNDRIRSYTYLYPLPQHNLTDFWTAPDQAGECAAEMVRRGYTAVKFDPAGPYTIYDGHQPRLTDIALSAAMVKSVREAVGDRADILFGTHGQFTAGGAQRMARAIEPYDPLWFEEPVPPDSPLAMAEVAAKTSIPVATGERLTTRWEFAPLIATRAASIFQPNTGRSGGILETKKIASMAEAAQIQIAPHCYCGPLVAAANIQVALTLPNFLILEAIGTWDGFHAELLEKKIGWQDGYVVPSLEPGLGVTLREDICEANPWTGSALHLEMRDMPIGN